MTYRLLSIIIALLSLSSVTAQLSYQQVLDSIQSIMDDREIPGLFISVVGSDTTLMAEGFGLADVDDGVLVTSDHLFKIGSVTKTFTAIAVMQLIEKGHFSLDSELRAIAPEVPFDNPWETSHPVLLHHLLEHKAGFDDMHFVTMVQSRQPDMTALDEVMAHANAMKSRWQPGLVHSYSNPCYVILGHIIEKYSGMPYQRYIRDHVLRPLGMGSTHFISQVEELGDAHQYSLGYMEIDGQITLAPNRHIIGEAAGTLYSNASDMALFGQFFLDEDLQNKVFKNGHATLREMERVHSRFEQENNITDGYGLGIYSRTFGSDDVTFLGHSGGIHGFSSRYIYSDELNLAIAMSNNLGAGNGKILDLLVDHYGDTTPYEVQYMYTGDKVNPQEWTGTYRALTFRNEISAIVDYLFASITVETIGDSIQIAEFLGNPHTYIPISSNRYRSVQGSSDGIYLTELDGQRSLYYYDDLMVPTSATTMLLKRIAIAASLITGILLTIFVIVLLAGFYFRPSWRDRTKHMAIYGLPYWSFALLLAIFIPNLSLEGIDALGQISWQSVLIFLASIALPISTLYATYFLYKKWGAINSKWNKALYASLVIGAWILVIYVASFGWIGMRLWAY